MSTIHARIPLQDRGSLSISRCSFWGQRIPGYCSSLAYSSSLRDFQILSEKAYAFKSIAVLMVSICISQPSTTGILAPTSATRRIGLDNTIMGMEAVRDCLYADLEIASQAMITKIYKRSEGEVSFVIRFAHALVTVADSIGSSSWQYPSRDLRTDTGYRCFYCSCKPDLGSLFESAFAKELPIGRTRETLTLVVDLALVQPMRCSSLKIGILRGPEN